MSKLQCLTHTADRASSKHDHFMLTYIIIWWIVGVYRKGIFYCPSKPVWKNSKFPTAITAAVRLPRDSIANVQALPLAFIFFPFFSLAVFSHSSIYFAYFVPHHVHRHINNLQSTNRSSSSSLTSFPRKRTCTSPRIHTSLHSIAIICSYGYIKKYVHQGGNLRYEMFSPFSQGQEVMSRIFFLTVLSPKYGSLHRKVTLSVNSVQHSRLSFGCHVRLNSQSPRPWT